VTSTRSPFALLAGVVVVSAALAAGCSVAPAQPGPRRSTPAATTPTTAPTATSPTGAAGDGSVTSPPLAATSHFVIHRLAPGERPPQFVIVGFDGSGDVAQLTDWARITAQVGGNVTYFLSGVFMLDPSARMDYWPPKLPRGSSAIGFARAQDPVTAVTALLSQAWLDGNDIGTHFNGHFCGPGGIDRWSQADWVSEITQFDRFVDFWKTDNHLTSAPPTSYDSSVVVGGRTPCLEGNPRAYLPAMARMGFRYDTSSTGQLSWPRKTLANLWEFPLQGIAWKGGRPGTVLAMDYNLWAWYNKAQPITTDHERTSVAAVVEKSYLAAFAATYNGNRAPLFFGNHMNYWGCNTAYADCYHRGRLTNPTPLQHYGPFVVGLQQSYLAMCVQPDVECVSYRQMADWLDAQDPAVLAALQRQPAAVG
jgi:hypothetical protein